MALLLVLFVAFFVVVFLFLLPILFSLQAVGSLFVYPRQLRACSGTRSCAGTTPWSTRPSW